MLLFLFIYSFTLCCCRYTSFKNDSNLKKGSEIFKIFSHFHFLGRRSRRNSVSDDSQLTIENFGGSQDQLNMIGRAFEREKTFTNYEPAVPVRSSMADARGSILFDYDDNVPTMTTTTTPTTNTEKQDHETEKQPPIPMRRKSQTTDLHSKDILDGDITMQQKPQSQPPISANNINSILSDDGQQSIRKTSFATLPNTTTWQQQSVNYQKINNQSESHFRSNQMLLNLTILH